MVPLTGSGGRRRSRRGAFERGAQDVDGLWSQLVQGPVAVDALAQIDLGQGPGPEMCRHIDEQAELHPVAVGESDLLEDAAMGRRLAGQRLADPRQRREQQLDPLLQQRMPVAVCHVRWA